MSDGGALVSEFADDPDMAELVEMFVAELGDRIQALEKAFADRDFNELQRFAHQLKGSAGGYGFSPITDKAAILEKSLLDSAEETVVRDALEELLTLCRRATSQTQG